MVPLCPISQRVTAPQPDAPGTTGRNHFRLHFRPVGRSAAFFDLDKTVIAKSSALAFGRPFYRDGLISRRDVVKSAYAQLMFRLGGGGDEVAMARTRDYLAALTKGWRVEQVQQIVAETLNELINPYVYAEAATLITEHQAAGRDVVLVSASGDEMVRPIGELLGITDVIATRMSIVDGRYSGEIEFYAAGANKVRGIEELATVRGYDLADCYAYSDSATDLPLLEAVGHPSAVNPDRSLRRAAVENGWPILEFRNPIPAGRRIQARTAVPVAAALGVGVAATIGIAIYARHRRSRALA